MGQLDSRVEGIKAHKVVLGINAVQVDLQGRCLGPLPLPQDVAGTVGEGVGAHAHVGTDVHLGQVDLGLLGEVCQSLVHLRHLQILQREGEDVLRLQ